MLQQIALPARRATLITAASLLAVLTAIPAFMPALVSAAPPVAERELLSTSARPDLNTDLTWRFDTTADAANVEYIEIEFCDSPLGACGNGTVDGGDDDAIPADNIPVLPASPTATIGGPGGWAAPANTATRSNGDAGATNNQINIDVTTGFAGASADEASIAVPSFTNDDDANKSYYTRMRIYSDAGTTLVWEGVFAQSTSQTLTVNARVQERLDFCVGADDLDNATDRTNADNAADNDCVDITGSAVDLGNIENGFTNVSPVDAVNGGDDENGIAMIRTNAFSGVVIDYKTLQESGSGALKVPGAACGDLTPVTGVTTDRCFNSSTTQSTIAAGTEEFGMTIAGVNCGSVAAYSCVFGTSNNLLPDTEYDGNGLGSYLGDNNQVPATTAGGYAWEAGTTADRIAGSSTVIDDEALILKFAATAGVTTPTGSYTVQADFIATATF